MPDLSSAFHFIHQNLSLYQNRHTLFFNKQPLEKNHVNLHYWHLSEKKHLQNLGDYLSKVVVEYMANRNGIDLAMPTSSTQNLYAIGSILQTAYHNATIWGSGFLNDPFGSRISSVLHNKHFRKLDLRAVRGPKTRDALIKLGHKCPEIYGDPAIIMPEIYLPTRKNVRKKQYSVVQHFTDTSTCDHTIPILTTDYIGFIDKICSSELIISSSLHGIILAEAYGVPAILYLPADTQNNLTLYKYEDYYYGTERYSFPIAHTIQEALTLEPCPLPDLTEQRKILINTFPVDLWN